jgi:uncharacterized protein YkwD
MRANGTPAFNRAVSPKDEWPEVQTPSGPENANGPPTRKEEVGMVDNPLREFWDRLQQGGWGTFRRSALLRSCLIAAALMVTATVFAASGTGEMDQDESAVLEELNLARARPSEYARYVEEHKRNFKGPLFVLIDGRKTTRTVEGFKAVDEAIAFLKSVPPVPALSASRPLTLSARDHVNDIGPRGMTGHAGTDGSQPADRISKYGRPKTASGEVITFGSISARSIVVQLIVDDGVPGRDHRKNLFDPDFRAAGIAIGPHKTYERVCVIDVADRVDGK